MKSKLFLLGAATLLFAACQDELQQPDNQVSVGGGTPLSINVLANPSTKALVEGNTLPAGKIGVKLVDATGTTYDSQTYNNIFYNTADGTTWTVDATNKILLSATEGKAYAYYPYTENASLDFTAIPIESAENPDNQTDYMFGNEASGLKNSNPSANFTMSHAMSIVNFTIAKGTYSGSGNITSVKMSGNTASNTGTMNAVAGSVTATNAGYEFTSTNSLTLGSSSVGKFIVVPSSETSALNFKVVMDAQTYTATTDAVALVSGKVYKYTLTLNSTGMTVSTVTVTPWGDPQNIGTGSGDTELMTFADMMHDGFQGVTTDGVYAVKADGTPVAYAEASDDTYAAVAFVLNGKAYQVAKTDATGYDGASTVYWWNPYQNVNTLTDIRTVDGIESRTYGYLAGSSIPQLSKDPSEWTRGALADFNGQTNTQLIIAAQDNGNTDKTLGKAVMDFRGNPLVNESQTDWFCPACGELAYMFLKKTELNDLLSKVSGTQFSTTITYWSSSEESSYNAWLVEFSGGYVYRNSKSYDYRVRLVRAI